MEHKNLIIIGAGGHGKVAADIALAMGRYQKISFLDDRPKRACPFPVVGTLHDSARWRADSDFLVAIGVQAVRREIQEHLESMGAVLTTLVHPSAVLGSRVTIGAGTVVMAGTVINCDVCIGRGCIVNTGATVDHDSILGDFVHLSPGVHLGGSVTVGSGSWLGIGSTVVNNCKIIGNCVIGAGAAVCRSTAEPGTYVGVPAHKKVG